MCSSNPNNLWCSINHFQKFINGSQRTGDQMNELDFAEEPAAQLSSRVAIDHATKTGNCRFKKPILPKYAQNTDPTFSKD